MTQRQALDILKLGNNVFLTGSAGSGKTFVLNSYIEYLHQKGITVGITAATGVAATHLNGLTINSWAGIGIKSSLTETEIAQLLRRPYLRKRFQNTHVLIIDEVSMLTGEMLATIDRLAREFRDNEMVFGGMQVVLCGDFFQLPPISKNQESRIMNYESKYEATFLYESEIWEEMDLKICYLDREYRQEDEEFLHVLHEIRGNAVCRESIKKLAGRIYKTLDDELLPTKLYTTNANIDAINMRELAKIDSVAHEFLMNITGNTYLSEIMRKNCLAPERLVLKVGAFVMFVKNNLEKGYVNGTLGTVIDFDKRGFPVVETHGKDVIVVPPTRWTIEEEGEVSAKIEQIPLRLAWAISIHKSQGMSLDAAEIDLRNPFLPGMGYVALSRVKTLDGVRLLGLNHKALLVNEKILSYDKVLQMQSRRSVAELREIEWSVKENLQRDFVFAMRQGIRSLYRYEFS
jgi:ATP-dependent DNA helicase PIF1